jgi:LPS export ABC transporter protein LptC
MKTVLILAGLLPLWGGCSLTYEKDQTPQPDQIPQMVFETLHQTSVKDGRTVYTVDAEKAEVYKTKKQMLLDQFRFQEYDAQGNLASVGEAESATIDTTTNDARVTGHLKARSEEQKVTLEFNGGQFGGLTWTNDDRILRTEPNTVVRLSKDDGSKIEAQRLVLDLGSNKLELEENVRGTWTTERKKNADKTSSSVSPGADSPQ